MTNFEIKRKVHQMYTLIAFKPEKEFYDRGDDCVLPSILIREDNLSREECINKIVQLSTETPLIQYRYGQEPDCVFEEFHVIPISITEEVGYDEWNIKDDASSKIKLINEEKKKEAELRRKNYEEERLTKEKEERRKKFLELQKEFATNV